MPGPTVKLKIAPKIVAASLERDGPYTGAADATRELKSWVDFKGVETPRATGGEEIEPRLHTHTDPAR
jgi:hypothetical protein